MPGKVPPDIGPPPVPPLPNLNRNISPEPRGDLFCLVSHCNLVSVANEFICSRRTITFDEFDRPKLRGNRFVTVPIENTRLH